MIWKFIRTQAINELMDKMRLGMYEEGQDLSDEAFMAAAEKRLNQMIEAATAALKSGQKLPVIKEALIVQGISAGIAEELAAALSD